MIAIIDYGAGNIFSVKNALDYIGVGSALTKDPSDIKNADAVILPGVGAFPSAMKKLSESGLAYVIKEEAVKKPFLGICLGMQLLFERGCEFEETQGLGLISGSVELMETGGLSLPHIGWNRLEINHDCELLHGVGEAYVYFVHSYAAKCAPDTVSAYCDYAGKRTALVNKGTVYGAQFHPEKSGEAGLAMLKNFANTAK